MEERCAQFQADAARPRDPVKTVKEIERLRKFLFKNQEYRFTDREQTHLFGAIQAHYAAHCELSETEREPALMLVDDALKMPFTGEVENGVSWCKQRGGVTEAVASGHGPALVTITSCTARLRGPPARG